MIGRTTTDLNIQYIGSYGHNEPMAVINFTIAVPREGKKDEADFIWCVAFRKTAELIYNYVKKGERIGIVGHWRAESKQDKDGKWTNYNKCVIDRVEFLENKKDSPRPPVGNDYGDFGKDNTDLDDLPF